MAGQTFKGAPYPANMRTQLWPLCCGAKILSGFKDVGKFTEEQLVEEINKQLKLVPDFQVYVGEQINPVLTFLTLNHGQMGSPKIMNAVKACGFVKVFEASPRGSPQGFFVHDKSGTFKACG